MRRAAVRRRYCFLRIVARVEVVRFRAMRMHPGALELLDQHAPGAAHRGICGIARAFENGVNAMRAPSLNNVLST